MFVIDGCRWNGLGKILLRKENFLLFVFSLSTGNLKKQMKQRKKDKEKGVRNLEAKYRKATTLQGINK
jgi:hypothetical protein